MLPVIAALLRPVLAISAVFAGSLGMALAQTSFYQVFGLLGLLIPIIAAVSGSLAFHYRWGPIVPWAYVGAGSAYYLTFSKGGTILWLVPYALVIVSLPLVSRAINSLRIGLLTFYTAMSEQVTMNILSISILGLVGPVWLVITPFMFSERTLATVGGTVMIIALKSRLSDKIELRDPVRGR